MLKSLFLVNLLLYIATSVPAQSGLIFDDAAYERVPMIDPDASRSISLQLPPQASLKAYCPVAGNQEYTQTCVGWAVGYAARTILYAKSQNRTHTDSITQMAFSPDFVYRNVSFAPICDTGICFSPALLVLKEKGVVFKTKLSTCARRIPDSLFSQARSYQIEDFRRLFELQADTDFKINALKRSLAEGNPVVIGAYLPPSFTLLKRNKDSWSPTEALETYLNQDKYGHAVCVVGYDDTKFGGAFEMQNSYGENWGEKGFCWVKYKDLAACTVYAFELIPLMKGFKNVSNQLVGDLQFVMMGSTGTKIEMKATLKQPDSTRVFYQMDKSYAGQTQFKLLLRNHEPAYVYAIATDAQLKIDTIFPTNNISAALIYKSNEVALPIGNQYFTMDNTVGTDIFCLLYSKEALPIGALCRQMEQETGTFAERLRKTLKDKLVPNPLIQYGTSVIQFKADLGGKTVVPIVVEIPHH